MPEIVMRQTFAAPPERVFAAFADHEGFGRWMGADIRVERAGAPSPDGVGAVRAVRARGLTVREEVTRFEPPHAMDYRVVAGAPFRAHRGEVRVSPHGDGAQLDYRIRFAWPWYAGGAPVGALVARLLEREMRAGLARMAAALR